MITNALKVQEMQQIANQNQQEAAKELNQDHLKQIKSYETQIKNLTSQLHESQKQNLSALTNFKENETLKDQHLLQV